MEDFLKRFSSTSYIIAAAVAANAVAVGAFMLLQQQKGRIKCPGLVNVGTQCFVNSTIQCLSSCLSFNEQLKSQQRPSNESDQGPSSSSDLIAELSSLLDNLVLLRRGEEDQICYSVRRLCQHITQSGVHSLSFNEQDDSANFLFALLGLVEQLQPASTQSLSPADSHPPPIRLPHALKGLTQTTLLCKRCNRIKSTKLEPFSVIHLYRAKSRLAESFSSDGTESVSELLRMALDYEYLDGARCDACFFSGGAASTRPVLLKVTKLARLPRVLCLQVVYSNSTQRLSPDFDLTIATENRLKTAAVASCRAGVKYKLRSFACYRGDGYRGHYFAYKSVTASNRARWFYCSDEDVRPASVTEVASAAARPMLLFYERQSAVF